MASITKASTTETSTIQDVNRPMRQPKVLVARGVAFQDVKRLIH